MRRRLHLTIAQLAVALAIAPSAAWADGYFVPFIGANFGGDVGRPLSETADDRNRFTFGFGVGGMAGGVFGAEFDFGYTRNFYASDGTVVTKSNLITAMPALVVGIPVGGQRGPGIRPYLLAGAGLLRRDLDIDTIDTLSRNDWGYTVGGGIMGYFSDRVGLRADLRYFRNFEVDDIDIPDVDVERGTFNFGRASIGLLFRF